MKPTVISTFAGCGGSSLGYKWAGYKELLAIDFDKNAVDTFKLNFDCPVWLRDIKTVTSDEILKFTGLKPGGLDVLDGSPPCQGFSTAGKMDVSDTRNQLFLEFKRLIDGLQPKVFVMENVTGMMKGKMKGMFNQILEELKSLNYNVKCKLMNAMWYEVPQSRERLIFIGVREGLSCCPKYPISKKSAITVGEAIGHLVNQEVPPLSKCFMDIVPKMKQGQSVADVTGIKKHMQTRRAYLNKPCPTITKIIGGIGFGSLIHPLENRVFSIDELKVLQSFPIEFKMIGGYKEERARIGNSVPPKMMYHIAKTIKEGILEKI